jgi:ketosteroid isomerase-like protein
MKNKIDTRKFATAWINSWNSNDLDIILSHYSDDVEITSPMIKLAAGIDAGHLRGKDRVADYWEKALKKIPDLHFELIDIAEGVDSIALYYKSVMNKKTVEVMFFNEEGEVNKVIAHYTS